MSDALFQADDLLDCPICNNLYNAIKTESDATRPCLTCDCYDDGEGGALHWFTLAGWKMRLAHLPDEHLGIPVDTFSLTPRGLGLMMALNKKTTDALNAATSQLVRLRGIATKMQLAADEATERGEDMISTDWIEGWAEEIRGGA